MNRTEAVRLSTEIAAAKRHLKAVLDADFLETNCWACLQDAPHHLADCVVQDALAFLEPRS